MALLFQDRRIHQMRALLGRLPAELHEQVVQLVFTFDTYDDPTTITSCTIIDDDYRPPTCLRVDRDTRKMASELYYRNTRFVVPNLLMLEKWVNSLSVLDVSNIRAVHYAQSQDEFWRHCKMPNHLILASERDGNVTLEDAIHYRLVFNSRINPLNEDMMASGAHKILANFVLRISEVRQMKAEWRDSPAPRASNVIITFMGNDEWDEKQRQSRTRLLMSGPCPKPVTPSMRDRVLIDRNYKAPDFSGSAWTATLTSAYYQNTEFTSETVGGLEEMLRTVPERHLLDIRRVHLLVNRTDAIDLVKQFPTPLIECRRMIALKGALSKARSCKSNAETAFFHQLESSKLTRCWC